MINFFAGRRGIKRIILAAAALLLAAAFIIANVLLDLYSPMLHAFFGDSAMIATTTEAKNALAQADELVREIAEESVVLLKNETVDGKPFLPRSPSEKFNLFGWGATDDGFLLVGGGSGGTSIDETNERHTTLGESFDEAGIAYNRDLLAKFAAAREYDADGGSAGADASESLFNPPASFYTQELLAEAHGYSTTAVAVLSRWGCENGGEGELLQIGSYRDGSFLELTPEERAMFDALERTGFRVVVVLNTCNPIELGFLEEYSCIKACLYAGIPGQSGAFAIPELLVGQRYRQTRNDRGEVTDETYRPAGTLSPSGRLADTLAYDYETHNPSYANSAVAGDIVYQEGIYVGYKWYETAEEAGYYAAHGTSYENVVQFPFGYGLSYTRFTQQILSLGYLDGGETVEVQEGEKLEKDRTYCLTVRVTNEGSLPGRDVVQLYWSSAYRPDGIERASVNLLAFAKTVELQPQSYEDVRLTFTAYDMASYDAYDRNRNEFKGYELDPFDYEIKLMCNAHEQVALPEEGEESLRSRTLACDGIRFGEDPVTGSEVKNRFTGVDAYADMPIDGDGGLQGSITYLSRNNAFENFPTVRAPQKNNVAETAGSFKCVGDTEQIDYPTGEPFDGSLLQHADGSGAELDELDGSEETDGLVHNDALFKELSDWNSPQWERVLNALSRDEIKDLIGKGGYQTVALESIGKPRNRDNNGSAGFSVNVNTDAKNECTVFPAESLVGCSWSTRLTYELGHMQGFIAEAMKIQGWYAPGVNLHRSVFNSRNFEYYSEDGVLSGKLAAGTVHGAKENNLYCYVKHFVLAETGEDPKDWYTWTTEQALRENYLKPFEICVKEGGANAMMSGLNKLGAVWCGYNRALLTDILRGEWGFKGSVVTDKYEGVGYMDDYDTALKAGCGLWLNNKKSSADISFGSKAVDRAAHDAVKGILYTYVDTYATALGYREKVAAGQVHDPYVVTLKVNITAAPYSPLFAFLWSLTDIVLLLGMGTCILFMFLPRKK